MSNPSGIFSKVLRRQDPNAPGCGSGSTYDDPVIPNEYPNNSSDWPTPQYEADWKETPTSHIFVIEAPGIPDLEHINITKRNLPSTGEGYVSISGGRPEETPLPPGSTYLVRRRRNSHFHREFHLRGPIDEESPVSPRLENGVLTVVVNKQQQQEEEE